MATVASKGLSANGLIGGLLRRDFAYALAKPVQVGVRQAKLGNMFGGIV